MNWGMYDNVKHYEINNMIFIFSHYTCMHEIKFTCILQLQMFVKQHFPVSFNFYLTMAVSFYKLRCSEETLRPLLHQNIARAEPGPSPGYILV